VENAAARPVLAIDLGGTQGSAAPILCEREVACRVELDGPRCGCGGIGLLLNVDDRIADPASATGSSAAQQVAA
jgi:hypothetical protein